MRRIGLKWLLLFAVFFSVDSVLAQWQTIGNLDSFERQPDGVLLKSGKALVALSVLANDLVRIRAARDGAFMPDQSAAVVKSFWEKAPFVLRDADSAVSLETPELIVQVRKRPLRISFTAKDGTLLNADDPDRGISWSGPSVRVWKLMPQTEQIYGLGEKSGGLNRRDHHFTMWNTDIPAYKADTDPLYQTIPFFYGIDRGRAYGIFFDNSYWSSFDMGKESPDRYSFGATGGELNYYFFSGPSPSRVLERFTELVGRMPLPPRWSLGYQQCRWSYFPESRVRALAADFRAKQIPCDVLYLDIDYMEGYRIFTWSKKNFPDPKKMIGDLAKDGFRIVTIVDPGIKVDSSYDAFRTGAAGDLFLKHPDGRLYTGKVWPGVCAFPDFSNSQTRAWWGANMEALTSVGVSGFWNDMNEPSVFDVPTKTVDLDVVHDDNGLRTPHAKNHNTYGLEMTRASYEGAVKQRPGERPFILTRASYAGGQRYSAAWTGDNISSWEHLEMAVPMMLGLSISGQPFVGTDIGGFVGNPDGELYVRWLQLGVFSPLMRTHTEWGSKDQEPWSYGPAYEAINRRTIEFRYELLPYIYNAMRKASETGVPPMRPVVFDYPEDPRYFRNSSDFMFGEGLLIAPVLWPGSETRSVNLPPGTWYDYWTGERFPGGKRIEVPSPIDRIPMFARAGAVVPTQQLVQYSAQAPIDPLTITLFAGDSARYEYYEDDGLTFEYRKGVFAKRTITFVRTKGKSELVMGEVSGSYRPPQRSLVLRVVGVDKQPSGVGISGAALDQIASGSLKQAGSGWAYDAAAKILLIKTVDRPLRDVVTFD